MKWALATVAFLLPNYSYAEPIIHSVSLPVDVNYLRGGQGSSQGNPYARSQVGGKVYVPRIDHELFRVVDIDAVLLFDWFLYGVAGGSSAWIEGSVSAHLWPEGWPSGPGITFGSTSAISYGRFQEGFFREPGDGIGFSGTHITDDWTFAANSSIPLDPTFFEYNDGNYWKGPYVEHDYFGDAYSQVAYSFCCFPDDYPPPGGMAASLVGYPEIEVTYTLEPQPGNELLQGLPVGGGPTEGRVSAGVHFNDEWTWPEDLELPDFLSFAGDYNQDLVVDYADYTLWASQFGGAGEADGNGDGVVDAADYTVWRDNLFGPSRGGGSRSIPEPRGSCLLACTVAIILQWRDRRLRRVAGDAAERSPQRITGAASTRQTLRAAADAFDPSHPFSLRLRVSARD